MKGTTQPSPIQILRTDVPLGGFEHALFDFDGTISLIRQGWQQVMGPYFTEVLLATPGADSPEQEQQYVRDFIDQSTGRQTIYQCIELAEQVRLRGGTPLDPKDYKGEYGRRLALHIGHRLHALRSGALQPADCMVPGAQEILSALHKRGVQLHLASGTDHDDVVQEARLLGVDGFFTAIHGAREDYQNHSKAKVIERLLAEHDLHGRALLGFGDGYVEIENVRQAGGLAVGVAGDEERRVGWDPFKVKRLSEVGAHILIADFTCSDELIHYLFA